MRQKIQAGLPVVIAFFLIVFIEAGLRLAGYGYSPEFFIKQVVEGRESYINNIFYTQKFFTPELIRTPVPLRVDRDKRDNTIRIAIAGESAALGDPDYSFGFARILKVMLEDHHPEINFEIINTSITAVNSHVILPIVKETQKKIKPDVFLIYMGNNEVIGPYGPNATFSRPASSRNIIKFNIALNSTRLGMLARNTQLRLFRKNLPEQWDGMEMFLNYKVSPGDGAIEYVHDNFRGNLREICRIISENSKVILSTVAVNLKDCPPFYSMNHDSLQDSLKWKFNKYFNNAVSLIDSGDFSKAKGQLENALEMDYHHAAAHYLLGEILYDHGEYNLSRKHYTLALDNDALKFRADSDLNKIIGEVYGEFSENNNVSYLDMNQMFKDSVLNNIAGSDIFLEHVHFNFFGNYLMAYHFKRKIENELGMDPSFSDVKSIDYYKRRLAYTPFEADRIHRETLGRLKRAPFTGRLYNEREKKRMSDRISEIRKNVPREETYLNAIKNSPHDWIIKYNYALYLMRQGIFNDTALALLGEIKRAVPQNPTIDFNMGYWYENHKQYDKALKYYQKATDILPNYSDARKNTASLMLFGEHPDARKYITGKKFTEPELFDIYIKAGNMCIKQDRMDQAKDLLEAAYTHNSLDYDLVNSLSALYLRNDEYFSAIKILNEYRLHYPLNSSDLFKLGVAFEGMDNYRNALEYYKESLQSDSTNFIIINKIGQMHYLLGNYVEAIEYYGNSTIINPGQRLEFAYTNIALAYSNLGESEKAISYFEKAVEIAPEKRDILYRMAREYQKAGQIMEYKQLIARIEQL